MLSLKRSINCFCERLGLNYNNDILIHFLIEETGSILTREYSNHVPRIEDEIRVGGEFDEKFYKVTRVIWVYDEPECPYDRVNIGVTKIEVNKC